MQPHQRLHRLRGGDGPSVPSDPPPPRWPDLDQISDYWDSFTHFARTELTQPTMTFRVLNNGKWKFIARDRNQRTDGPLRQLVYDPEDDTIEFSDPEVDSGWVMEDAFGGEPTAATSRL